MTRLSYRQRIAASAAVVVLATLAALPAAAGAATFSTNDFIVVGDGAPASPYPSSIAVSGLSGTVSKVTATFRLSHQHPADVDVLLVAPSGGNVVLLSDAGGSIGVPDATLTFDDSSQQPAPYNTQLQSGTYFPSNYNVSGDTADSFPGVNGPYHNAYFPFNGTNPNGTWSLYVVDDSENGHAGGISGWSLDITTSGTSDGGGEDTDDVDYDLYPCAHPDPPEYCNDTGYDDDEYYDDEEYYDEEEYDDEDGEDCPQPRPQRPSTDGDADDAEEEEEEAEQPRPKRPSPDGETEGEKAYASACGTQSEATPPPNTKITKGPPRKMKKRRALFSFEAAGKGTSFECKLDKGKFKPCSSPHRVKVKPGKHVFQVRAVDEDGNAGKPAKRAWTVRR